MKYKIVGQLNNLREDKGIGKMTLIEGLEVRFTGALVLLM